jgi:hypothetical protein
MSTLIGLAALGLGLTGFLAIAAIFTWMLWPEAWRRDEHGVPNFIRWLKRSDQ